MKEYIEIKKLLTPDNIYVLYRHSIVKKYLFLIVIVIIIHNVVLLDIKGIRLIMNI